MTSGVEYVREICKKRKIAISTLEKDCGFANGYLNPKKVTKIPYDRAVLISNYLNVDINNVLGVEVSEKKDQDDARRQRLMEYAEKLLDLGITPDNIAALIELAEKMSKKD